MTSQPRSIPTIHEIAEVLRGAQAKGGPALVDALALFAADRVTVRHHPPRQYVDGDFTGAEWIEFERSVVDKVGARAADMKSEEKKVSVVDDTIVLEEVIVGQGPDGTTFRVPSKLVLPVRDGQILGYDAYYDAAATPPFMQDSEIEVREER